VGKASAAFPSRKEEGVRAEAQRRKEMEFYRYNNAYLRKNASPASLSFALFI
jgi:hypothetical protein